MGTLKIIHNKVVKRERNRSSNASNSWFLFLIKDFL